nr:PfkB family carbohydrate kinase [Microbacterium halimionae]
MTGRVVVIGDALIDELRDDAGVREFVGGAALNVAVGLARLGFPTSLIAMVGDDSAGAHIRTYLDDYGVSLIPTIGPYGTSRAVSVRSAGGEPTYQFNEAAQRRRVNFGDAEIAAVSGAAMTVISCFPFDNAGQTRELAEVLETAGGQISIDPNPRSGMMHDRGEFVRGFERIVAGASLAKVGDDDAALLYGTSLEELRARLVSLGVESVLATAGAAGASVEAGDVVVSAPISRMPGPIIDTMGAGDAVLSSTVASLLSHHPGDASDWTEVLVTAMDVAAATCRFEGALLRLPSALSGLSSDRFGS